MKILLITLAVVGLAAGYGNPARRLTDGKPEIQRPQNSSPDNPTPSTQERPASSQASFQVKRQEFRRFGTDAFPTNSQSDISSYNRRYEMFDDRNKNGQNLESQNGYKEQSYNFPPVDQMRNVGFPNANSYQQDLLKSDSPYNFDSQVKTSSGQEIRKSGTQSGQERSSFSEFHNQEISQGRTPFSTEHSSQIQTELHNNRNEFDSRFPSRQNQVYQTQQTGFQNQNTFNPTSADNQQSQFQQGRFFQADSRESSGINQDMQSATRKSSFPQQEQFQTSRANQEQPSQYQQNKQSRIPSAFARDTFINQQNSFEPKRISPSDASLQLFQGIVDEQEKYIPAPSQFRRNHPQRDQKSRIAGNVEDSRFSANINFSEDANKQNRNLANKFNTVSRTQDLSQGLLQNLGKEQPVSMLPQFRQTQNTSVLISGNKGVAVPPPTMMYKTGSVASPHAVVIGKTSGIVNKASISQHLHTPFTQYTYSHPL